jgi:hypothetical protein
MIFIIEKIRLLKIFNSMEYPKFYKVYEIAKEEMNQELDI